MHADGPERSIRRCPASKDAPASRLLGAFACIPSDRRAFALNSCFLATLRDQPLIAVAGLRCVLPFCWHTTSLRMESRQRGRPALAPGVTRAVRAAGVRAGRCRRVRGWAGPVPAIPAAVAACQLWDARRIMSLYSGTRLPPYVRMAKFSFRHSGWSAMMPRSRQMSAMTVPIGRRRTSAAICSGVGRWVRSSPAARTLRGRCGGGPRPVLGLTLDAPAGTLRRRCRIRVGALHEPCLERVGAEQAKGDAREDQPDVARAEGAGGGAGVGRDAALGQRGSEFLAVVDQPADELEEAPDATLRILGWRCYGRVGHERYENTLRQRLSRNIFLEG